MATYLTHSISESFHASFVAQHQDVKKSRKGFKSTEEEQKIKEEVDKVSRKNELSPCVQCLLVMIFVGIELSAAFTVIYSVLFLQFLGVPISLVSVTGVICGTSAFIILPLIGWLSDRGSNPVKRKIVILTFGFIAYVVGFAGLGFCSAMKLTPTDYTNTTSDSTLVGSHNVTVHSVSPLPHYDGFSFSNGTPIDTISQQPPTKDHRNPEFTYISVIGILCFSVLDMAFDICMSLCRAFVLECSPPSLHSRLLFMATTFGAASSCLVGFVGSFDIPAALGRTFHVDGTPATILMFSFSILLVSICCFACTLITGYMLTKDKYKDTKETTDTSATRYTKRFKKSLSKLSLTKRSTESVHNRTNPTEPLLPTGHRQGKSLYNALGSRSDERQNSFDNENDVLPHRLMEDESNILHENKVLDITRPFKKSNDGNDSASESDVDSEHLPRSRSESENNYDNESDFEVSQSKTVAGIPPMLSPFITSYSASVSIIQSNRVAAENPDILKRQIETLECGTKSIYKNKRLMILCVSIFFSMAAMLCFNQYGGNVLTIGIYHGDPNGALGSHGRQMYDKGLRKSALAFLVCYLMYSAGSLFTKKIVDLIGEKGQYILSQIALAGVDLTLILLRTEDVYFVTAAVSGFYRSCPFTLGYIMANKIAQEDSQAGDGKSPPKNVGQVMVLIGMMMPCSYLLFSSFMGPVMSVTNNTLVPIMCGGASAAMALLVFCLLFVVKK